jgi:CxxC motif-containing protein (DUF1111 family)
LAERHRPYCALGFPEYSDRGHGIFESIGCASCHVSSIVTARNPAGFIPHTTGGVAITWALNEALTDQIYHPFGDFLLHDMGPLGDGITNGAAGPTMMRTMPLWGVRDRAMFLHDGRALDLTTAITFHDGQGKAAAAQFGALPADQQQNMLDFLGTL